MTGRQFTLPAWSVTVVLAAAVVLPGCKKSGGTDAERATTPAAEADEPLAADPGSANPRPAVAEDRADSATGAATDAVDAAPPGEEENVFRGDGYEGVLLPSDQEQPGGAAPWVPTADDIAAAERLLRAQLPGMTASPEYQQDVITEMVTRLPEYRRQYVPRRGPEGHRVLWINLFRSGRFPDRTEGIVVVRGGGHDYFNLEVDLDAGTCRALRINSPR